MYNYVAMCMSLDTWLFLHIPFPQPATATQMAPRALYVTLKLVSAAVKLVQKAGRAVTAFLGTLISPLAAALSASALSLPPPMCVTVQGSVCAAVGWEV